MWHGGDVPKESVTLGWICPAAWAYSTIFALVIFPQPRRRPAQTPAPWLGDAGGLLCARHILLDQMPSLLTELNA